MIIKTVMNVCLSLQLQDLFLHRLFHATMVMCVMCIVVTREYGILIGAEAWKCMT